jgi:hypothetical protein
MKISASSFYGYDTQYEELGHSCQYGGLFIYAHSHFCGNKFIFKCWMAKVNLCDNTHKRKPTYFAQDILRVLFITFDGYSQGHVHINIVNTACMDSKWLSIHPNAYKMQFFLTGTLKCQIVTFTPETPPQKMTHSGMIFPAKVIIMDRIHMSISISAKVVNDKVSQSSSERRLVISDTKETVLSLGENEEASVDVPRAFRLIIDYHYVEDDTILQMYNSWARIRITFHSYCSRATDYVIDNSASLLTLAFRLDRNHDIRACTLLILQDDRHTTTKHFQWNAHASLTDQQFGLHFIVTPRCDACKMNVSVSETLEHSKLKRRHTWASIQEVTTFLSYGIMEMVIHLHFDNIECNTTSSLSDCKVQMTIWRLQTSHRCDVDSSFEFDAGHPHLPTYSSTVTSMIKDHTILFPSGMETLHKR